MKKETEEARLIREWLERGNEAKRIPREPPVIGGAMVRGRTNGYAGKVFARGKGEAS